MSNLAVPADSSPGSEVRSPMSEARKHGMTEAVKLLRTLGASVNTLQPPYPSHSAL